MIKAVETFEYYMNTQTKNAESTTKKYINIIRQFIDFATERNGKMGFTFNDCNEFIANKTKGNKQYNCVKYALQQFLISMNKKQWIDELKPLKAPERQKDFKYFTPETMDRIIKLLKYPFKQQAFIQAVTGLRPRESASLKIQNFNLDADEDLIFISIQEYTKGKKRRTAYLQKKYEPAIVRMFRDRRFGFLFLNEKYEGADDKTIQKELTNHNDKFQKALKPIGDSLNIIGLSPHYIRHHFADTYILKGGSIYELQKILGHAKIETTEKYISVGDELVKRTLKGMN